MPRLTVTMPAYNAELTIARAVRSTLSALPDDSELVVLDDCSTDATLSRLGEVEDKRLRVVAGDTNVGGARARNELLRITDSEFIASMDADDVVLPWRFHLQLRALTLADVVFGGALRVRRGRAPQPSFPSRLGPKELPVAMLFHNPVFHPTLAAKRLAIHQVGGYRDLRVAQDYDLWLRLATSGAAMVRLAEPMIAYRLSATQVSGSGSYRLKVASSVDLREAYVNHVNKMRTDVGLRGEVFTADSPPTPSDLEESAAKSIAMMRPVNRWYYRRLLSSERMLHPLSAGGT
ncbi:glycosyltransferase [Microbacterium sp. Marseille-Q6648]|uniref:glycosyltransferase family 2 protein n=1 Tax=Microbacterium sp. Marseille-Q6648 TaxID=2937991 RepID=UPI002557F735|nr:glycosyltransferase [Microbacterium sp. Marseille-Q6648]